MQTRVFDYISNELRQENKSLNRFNHQLQEDLRQLQEQINLQPQQFEKTVEDISRDEMDFRDKFKLTDLNEKI